MTERWQIFSFLDSAGNSVFEGWYEAQSPTVKNTFKTTLKALRDWPVVPWKRPLTGKLSGECEGLIEIVFKEDNTQWRPLGCYGPKRMQFILLFPAKEVGDRFVPKTACKTALERKKIVEFDEGRIREYTID